MFGAVRHWLQNPFTPLPTNVHTPQKQSGLTLYQVAEALDAVPALFCNLLRDGRARLAEALVRL